MQYLFSFFVIDVLIKMFNCSMVHFLFQSISSIYGLYSKCSSCQFSYNFYNRKKFKRSGYQWPPWRHRRNRGRSYMTNVTVKVLKCHYQCKVSKCEKCHFWKIYHLRRYFHEDTSNVPYTLPGTLWKIWYGIAVRAIKVVTHLSSQFTFLSVK